MCSCGLVAILRTLLTSFCFVLNVLLVSWASWIEKQHVQQASELDGARATERFGPSLFSSGALLDNPVCRSRSIYRCKRSRRVRLSVQKHRKTTILCFLFTVVQSQRVGDQVMFRPIADDVKQWCRHQRLPRISSATPAGLRASVGPGGVSLD